MSSWPLLINAVFLVGAASTFAYAHVGETLSEYVCCRGQTTWNTTECAPHMGEDTYSDYTVPRVFLGLILLFMSFVPYTHEINRRHRRCDGDVTEFVACWMWITFVWMGGLMSVVVVVPTLSEIKCYVDEEWKDALSLYSDTVVWTIICLPFGFLFLVLLFLLLVACPSEMFELYKKIHAFCFPPPDEPLVRERDRPLTPPPEANGYA